MNRDAAIHWVIGALVVCAVGAGLYAVGGTGTGRMERRDATRLADLRALSTYVRCVANRQGSQLPDTLTTVEECLGTTRLADPYSGKPYEYVRNSPRTYRLCADFERLEIQGNTWFDNGFFSPSTGCADVTYYR